jgi:outer membrane lipoprotein SlyB
MIQGVITMHTQAQPGSFPQRSDTAFSEIVPGALKSLVDRYGQQLLGDASRLRGLLTDEVPQAKREISVLMLALEERVPQDLMRVHSGEPIASLTPRLTRRLTDEKALSPDAAQWAVHAWAQSLGVNSVLQAQGVPQGYGAPQAPVGFAAPHTAYPGAAPAFAGAAAGAVGAAAYAPPQGFPPPMNSAANQPYSYAPMAGQQAPMAGQPVASGASKKPLQMGAAALVGVAALAGAGYWFTVPKLDIARVETQGTFIGNGKPMPVFVDFAARNTQVRTAEVRLVRGEGTWAKTQWTVDVSPDGANATRVKAGDLSVSTSKPISATFEYTLIGNDGKRSAPFQRTFDIAPPLLIQKIDVPRSALVGKDFELGFNFQKSSSEVVRVERKVIESNQPFNETELSTPLQLEPTATGFKYKFEAMPRPTKATLEFTLVDAAGLRSDPVRVALNVGTPAPLGIGPGTVVSVRQISSGTISPTGGAVLGTLLGGLIGSQVGKGSGRTAAAAIGAGTGAIIGQRMAGGGGGSTPPQYETTIRLDEGSTRVITTFGNPAWAAGSRVYWNGSTLSLSGR